MKSLSLPWLSYSANDDMASYITDEQKVESDLTVLAPHMLTVMARNGIRAALGSQGESTDRIASMLEKVIYERVNDPTTVTDRIVFQLWFKIGPDDYNVKYRQMPIDPNIAYNMTDLLDDIFKFDETEVAVLAAIAD